MTLPFDKLREGRELSDFALDRVLFDEHGPQLPNNDAPTGSAADQARLAELREARDAMPSSCPAFRIAPEPRRPWWSWLTERTAVVGFAAAAATLLIAVNLPTALEDKSDTFRKKGNAPRLGFWVKHGDAVRIGRDHEIVNPEDRIRFSVSSDVPVYVTILSLDAEDTVSVYFPDSDHLTNPEPILAGDQTALPLATRLDGVLGEEQIVGIFCREPMSSEVLRERFTEAGIDLLVPEGCQIDMLTLIKEAAS